MGVDGVLIVDADAAAREGLVGDLSREGIEAEACGSRREACRLMRSGRFACAVVDVQIEDGDGLEAIADLRDIAPSTPIIVTAAENSRQLEARVRALNVFYYHVKGFGRGELIEAVKGALKSVAPAERTIPSTTGKTRQKRVLVIDDDPDYQAAVRTMLENAGFEVIPAFTREEGMEKIRSDLPDLVILDIMMEHSTDGFHLLYEMRSDPKTRHIPVLAVTAVSERTGFDFAPKEDGDYFPADDYIAKPVKAEELVARVRALLEKGT